MAGGIRPAIRAYQPNTGVYGVVVALSNNLPSITSLRAFQTTAKTLSFKKSAAALHLSPSAVSRQIAGLEHHLGMMLFDRVNPGLELTDAGCKYLISIEKILTELHAAHLALSPRPNDPLRISTLESFSTRWLVPKLPAFKAMHPEINLTVEATLSYADFTTGAVDVAIRFGTGPWEGLHSEPLVDMEFFPVCSPSLVTGNPPLRDVKHLASHQLIHLRQLPNLWRAWLNAAGNPDLCGKCDVVYDHVGIAQSAAVSGQGVTLSSHILCAQELADGRLCMPFNIRAPSQETYHLVCRMDGLNDPRICALRDWLVSELA